MIFPSQVSTSSTPIQKQTNLSIIIASSLIFTWVVSISILFNVNLLNLHRFWIAVIMLWQTFIYTGLFIIAHDAMHGVIYPQNSQVNHFFGSLALILYGFFPYQKMRKRHILHHQHPASDLDPDFHNGKHKNCLAWYTYFMFRYWNWPRFLLLVTTFHTMKGVFHIPENNLVLFWIIPSILSSLQLFYFGTFLPHREPSTGYESQLRTRSTYLPIFWSFITCYHFLYHREHHENPDIPWWGLPSVRSTQS